MFPVASSKEKLTSTPPLPSSFFSAEEAELDDDDEPAGAVVGLGCCFGWGALLGSELLTPAAHPSPLASTKSAEISFSDES